MHVVQNFRLLMAALLSRATTHIDSISHHTRVPTNRHFSTNCRPTTSGTELTMLRCRLPVIVHTRMCAEQLLAAALTGTTSRGG